MKIWHLVFVVIILFGFLLRSIELFSGNFLFQYDQGLYYSDVIKMFKEGKPLLIGTYTPIPGLFQHPLFYYLLAFFIFLFQKNPYGSVVFMFIISFASLFISYIVAKRLFSLKTAIVITFLLAVSESAAAAGRMLWPPYLIYIIMPFYIYFFGRVLAEGKKYLPHLLATVGFVIAVEIAAGSILLFPTMLSIYFLRRNAISPKGIVVSIVFFILLFSPLIVFDLRHGNIISKGVFSSITNQQSLGVPFSVLQTINTHNAAFLNNIGSSLSIFTIWWPFSLLICLILVVYVTKGTLAKESEKKIIFGLFLVVVFTYIELLMFPHQVWSWYLIPFITIYIFIFGFTFSKLFVPSSRVNVIPVLITWIIISIIIVKAVLLLYSNYTKDFNDYGGTAKIRGKIDVLDYIYNDAKGERFGLLIFTPPVYTFDYDYLVDWYGVEKYHYKPYKDKKGTFYLLVDPDKSKPWTYKGWMETVIKTGKIVYTKELPSGFIIQKRVEINET